MIPLQPVSVKFNDEERAKLKAFAITLGWTESKVIRDSVTAILHLIENPESASKLEIIARGRLIRFRIEKPISFPSMTETGFIQFSPGRHIE